MIDWIITNAATLVIGTLLLIFVVFTLRHTIRKAKKGQCMGCGGCNVHNSGNKDPIGSCNCPSSNKKQK